MYNSIFNQDISAWIVSSVTSIQGMFKSATAFNQDISAWDILLVTNMHRMFDYATAFNQDLSVWDVSSFNDMFRMFYAATLFNQDLCSWDIQTTDTANMFQYSGCEVTTGPYPTKKCHVCPMRRLAAATNPNDDDDYRSRNLQSDKSAEVGGLGTATLQFGSSRRLADDERNLQDNPVADIGMTIGVTTLDDGPAPLRTAGGATVGTTIITTILFASVVGIFVSTFIL